MNETETVALFAALADRLAGGRGAADVALGIGDDAALLVPPAGEQLVACVDTLNAGTHFLTEQPPESIGHRVLAVNLSDLAAMGADPRWVLLSLSLPRAERGWLEAFAAGLGALAGRLGVALVGGDVTRGPLAASLTALGTVPTGAALRRGTAAPGDRIWISGTVGGAALALAEDEPSVRDRLLYPTPRVALGRALRGVASACIDLSDGLRADLPRLLPGLAARIEAARLPLPAALRVRPDGWRLAVAGGDDYELCFCAPPAQDRAVTEAARRAGVGVTAVGTVGGDGEPDVVAPDGRSQPLAVLEGFEHFR